MKFRLLLLIGLLWGGVTIAQENFKIPLDRVTLKFDGRLDYKNIHEEGNISNRDVQGFQTSKMTIQTDIDIYKGLHFFYRQQFKNYHNEPKDGLGGQIEKLGISYENNAWKITVGKQWFCIGSYEQLYDPNDVYTYSGVNNMLPVWKTGVNVAYRFNKQEIGLQLVNGSESIDENKIFTQNDLYLNLYWYGSLANGRIIPMVNIASDLQPGQVGVISEIGARWNLNRFKLDTDFAMVNNMRGATPDDVLYISTPIRLYYEGKHVRPGFKYIFDYQHNKSDIDLEHLPQNAKKHANTFQGFINYYPYAEKDFNIHAVVAYADNNLYEYTNGAKTAHNNYQKNWSFVIGIRFGFELFGNK